MPKGGAVGTKDRGGTNSQKDRAEGLRDFGQRSGGGGGGNGDNDLSNKERDIIDAANEMDPGFAEMSTTRAEIAEAAEKDRAAVADILGGDVEATNSYMQGMTEFQDYLDSQSVDLYDIGELFGLEVDRDLFGGNPTAEVTGVNADFAAGALGLLNPTLGFGAKALNALGVFDNTGYASSGSSSGSGFGPTGPSTGGGFSGYKDSAYAPRAKTATPTYQAQSFSARSNPGPNPNFMNSQGQYATGSFVPWWRQGYSYTQ